jgi:hypothetical protein
MEDGSGTSMAVLEAIIHRILDHFVCGWHSLDARLRGIVHSGSFVDAL